MTRHLYDGGALRLGTSDPALSAEAITWGNGLSDNIYLAIMGSSYVLNVATKAEDAVNGQEHWSDISTYEISPTGTYPVGGTKLTTVAPYIESTLYAPLRYAVYTANSGSTPAYSISWSGVTFTSAAGVVLYKKGVTALTSPLLCFISDLSVSSASNDIYFIEFGTPGSSLGIFYKLLN